MRGRGSADARDFSGGRDLRLHTPRFQFFTDARLGQIGAARPDSAKRCRVCPAALPQVAPLRGRQWSHMAAPRAPRRPALVLTLALLAGLLPASQDARAANTPTLQATTEVQ